VFVCQRATQVLLHNRLVRSERSRRVQGLGGAYRVPATQLVDHGVQILATDILHRVVMQPGVNADLENRHDIAVMQAPGGLGLAEESLQAGRVASLLVRQQF
jgi:hypothetical protein